MPASGKPFLDTNVLVYAAVQEDPRRETARALLAEGAVFSPQVLNEFVAVARGKLRKSWKEISRATAIFRLLCPSPTPPSIDNA
jgi:predicted nucleic acid-binding protein